MSETTSSRNRILARLGAPQTPPPWGLVDVAATLFALVLGMFFLGSGVALFVFNMPDPTTLPPAAPLLIWSIGLMAALAYTLVTRRRTPEELRALRLGSDTRLPIPYLLLLGVAAALTIDLVVAALSATFHPAVQLSAVHQISELPTWIIGGAFVVLLQPLAEGIVFYGVILPRLRASLSPYAGIVVTAALYAALYLLVYAAALQGTLLIWFGGVMPFLLGIFIAGVRVYTESTRAAIFAQAGVGLTLLMIALILPR